jgi:lipid-A-disaccharide synthase
MTIEGLRSLFPMSELSLLGFTEVLPHLPKLLYRINQTVVSIRKLQPDVVLFIDASAFARAIAKRLRGSKIPLIQYKAPQAWAYWSWRARAVARDFNRVLVILPFEVEFFAQYGVRCDFIGHPVLETGAGQGDGIAFRLRYGIPLGTPIVCLLPGSRDSEIAWSLPLFQAVAASLIARYPSLVIAVPVVDSTASRVASALTKWPIPAILIEGESERFDCFAAADAALAVSGTVSVELAVARVPMVVCYRLAPFTAWLARRFIRIRYITVVNLVLGREVIPEILQETCQADTLAQAVTLLLADPTARAEQLKGYQEAIAQLTASKGLPTELAARVILETVSITDT